jgi:hypothetical protein
MTQITVHGSLVRAILQTLVLASDANRGSHLAEALETLNTEIDLWAVSGDGLRVLTDNDNQRKLTVTDELVRAAMLVAGRPFEAPGGTALRNALERLALELDTWAVDGSLKQRGHGPRVKE